MTEQLTVRLPRDLARALELAARRMGRKRSEVVRLALSHFLRSEAAPARPADTVRHLLGSLESGVPDLAERHREAVLASLRDGR